MGCSRQFMRLTDEEVLRRVNEAEADPSVLITFDELVSGLKHRGS